MTEPARELTTELEALERFDKVLRWSRAIQFGGAVLGALVALVLLDVNAYGAAGIVAVLVPVVWLLGYVVELQVTSVLWRTRDGRG